MAGLLIGFAASTLAYRYRILRVPFRSPFERMSRELNLTPAQRQQISDVMSDTRKKVIQLRLDSRRQRHQLRGFLQTNAQRADAGAAAEVR